MLIPRFSRRFLATVTRNPTFKGIQDEDLKVFEKILGSSHVVTKELELYNRDWSNWYEGKSSCVVLPESTEQVSAILAYCSQNKIAVVPQAGNTGLVGGSIPVHDELILSIKRLRNEKHFDETTGILTADAGFVLEELDNDLEQYGYMMPLDLGAKGSCLIGGNIATCAGGIRLLRYGSLHAHLLGLTAVLPDNKGTILNLGSALRKDNTSLHVPHLFLGSEGQLGIVTKVIMTAVPRPSSVHSVMLGVENFDKCKAILRLAKSRLSEILSSFELMDKQTIECLEDTLELKNVLQSQSQFNLLIETSGSNTSHDEEKMSAFLEECLSEGLADDGILAQSKADAAEMWKLRESAPLAMARDGWVYKHDVSLPLDHFYELTEVIRKRCGDQAKRIVTYGHLGDCNSHLNITSEKFDQKLYDRLYPFLYEWVASHGGSISAEHGIGQMKLNYAHLGKSPEERELMKMLKKTFDPNGIMNPYKMM